MDKSNQFNKKINKKNLYKLKFQFYFIFYFNQAYLIFAQNFIEFQKRIIKCDIFHNLIKKKAQIKKMLNSMKKMIRTRTTNKFR